MTIGTIFRIHDKTPIGVTSAFYQANGGTNCTIIDIDTSLSNFIKINSYSADMQTISGEFNCTFQEIGCNEKVQVTNGRFDLKYRF